MAHAMVAGFVICALLSVSQGALAKEVCGPGADRALVLSGGGTKEKKNGDILNFAARGGKHVSVIHHLHTVIDPARSKP